MLTIIGLAEGTMKGFAGMNKVGTETSWGSWLQMANPYKRISEVAI